MNKLSFISALIFFYLSHQVKSDSDLPALVTVTGTGKFSRTADQVTVNVGIQMRDVDLNKVRQDTDQKAADVIAYLKDQGIEDNDIQTSYLSVQPNYPYVDFSSAGAANIDQTKPNFYSATKSTTFVLRNLANYDDVMTGLYELGINSVNGVTFGLLDEEKGKEEAKARAAENAQQIATALADKLGIKLNGVYSISAVSYQTNQPIPIAFSIQSDVVGMGGESGPSIAGGQITITSEVSVSFYIKE